jgi:hypothetical protein
MFQTKFVVEIKTYNLRSKHFSENLSICEITQKNTVEQDTPQMTIQYGAWALRAG